MKIKDIRRCRHCFRDIDTAEGCSFFNIVYKKKDNETCASKDPTLNPLTYHFDWNDSEYFRRSARHLNEIGDRCSYCNALHGKLHHAGCQAEFCPRCGGGLMTCECPKNYRTLEILNSNKDVL